MTTYQSDDFEWTDEEELETAKNVSDMLTSGKSSVRKYKDGTCDVYDVSMGEEKATIVNIKNETKDSGSWKIYAGKFKHRGIGPFVEGSEFDKTFNNGKGIRKTINNKIAAQQALYAHGMSR